MTRLWYTRIRLLFGMIISWEEKIKNILQQAGVAGTIELSKPPKSEMGDFVFPCFVLAKVAGKNPVEVARSLADQIVLEPKSGIERVAAFGPYVNFFVAPGAMIEQVAAPVLRYKEKYGLTTVGADRKILIEYPSNNTHKEFHIGHFRNVTIGNTLVSLYRASGYKVHVVNYLNDFGAHVAKCLWGLQKLHPKAKPPVNKQKWLGEIYAEASRYYADYPEVAPEVAEIQKQMEAKDKRIWKLFMETRQWSIDKFNALFKELGVKYEAVFFEKDIKAQGQKMVDALLQQKIAKVGEGGAIIIDLTPYGLDIALMRKSNGVGLYLTSDLPLAEAKFRKFNADESIVITGQEQTFYFRQLYKILELMGFKKKLSHIAYGLVTLPEGKMASRTGNVVLYEDLRDSVLEQMTASTRERHPDWKEKKILANAQALAMAALKFDMQKHEANKNIVFDIKEATSFEGFSGSYILYAVARINSLLRKAKKLSKKIDYMLLTTLEEKELARLMGEYEVMVAKALANYNPSVVARYAFDLAKAFNDFYNKSSVLNSDNQALGQARLALAAATRLVLINTLGLLTIPYVEEM